MFTVFWRVIYYGFKNFWRHSWPSIATVAITVLALLVFVGIIFFNVATSKASASIQDKIDISVYFKGDTSEDSILNVKQSLESLSEVKQVDYISKEKALEMFKNAHKDDNTIMQALSELDTNPLVASLNIKAKNPDQYASIAEYLKSPNIRKYIENTSYSKNQVVIDRLSAIIKTINKVGLIITLALALIAGLVVFNTIRLAIYSNRDEIAIMRSVGASNFLVRGPYIVGGVIAGIAAAVIATIIVFPIAYFVSPYLKVFIPGLDIFAYFYSNVFSLLLYQVIFGVAIGSFSSFVAVRRYLRN